MVRFGDRLRSLREEKELSQEELGKVLSAAKSTISQYELGKRNPDPDTLIKLADYFYVSIDYLLGRTDHRELLKDPNYNRNINKTEINLDDLQIAAHDESGKTSPASPGLKKLIKEVLLEIETEIEAENKAGDK